LLPGTGERARAPDLGPATGAEHGRAARTSCRIGRAGRDAVGSIRDRPRERGGDGRDAIAVGSGRGDTGSSVSGPERGGGTCGDRGMRDTLAADRAAGPTHLARPGPAHAGPGGREPTSPWEPDEHGTTSLRPRGEAVPDLQIPHDVRGLGPGGGAV